MTNPSAVSESTQAKDLMAREVHSVDKDVHLESVLDVMRRSKVSKVPVTEKGRLVGIVTDGTIADKLGALHNKNVATNTLHASSVMVRDVQCAAPEDPWRHVLHLLDGDEVGLVPVVHDGVILGVITKADFLAHITADTPVSELAHTQLHSVTPDDRVVHARRLMLDNHIERLPVIEDGRVVGIISEMDIALALDTMKRRVEQNHQARHLDQLKVRDAMAQPVVTCSPDTPAAEAAQLMAKADVGCLPLVNGSGQISGMVTRSDLIRPLEATNAGG